VKNSEHAMVKTEEHACCSKSKAPDIFSSDVDWELSGVGLALRNWDSAYNSEGVQLMPPPPLELMPLYEFRQADELCGYFSVHSSPRLSCGIDFKQRACKGKK